MSDYKFSRGRYRLKLWTRVRMLFGYRPPPRSTSTLKNLDGLLRDAFKQNPRSYEQNPILGIVEKKGRST
jgi:hypothetical protein